MKYYIESGIGTKDHYHLFNLTTGVWVELINERHNIEKLYEISKEHEIFCFDLYKMKSFFGNSFPFVIDLQALSNLKLDKPEAVDELFDKNKSLKYFHLKNKLLSHLNSYRISKIKAQDFSLKELISNELFNEFYYEKLNCMAELINIGFDKQVVDYYSEDTTIQALLTLLQLSDEDIIINDKIVRLQYNFFGSKNSRLSLRNKDFNIYNLPKDKRSCIKAPEDFILAQFDYKSFQPRISLALFASDEIKVKIKDIEDIYSIFPGDRESNKIELISWMFSNRRNAKFDMLLSSIKDARYKLWQSSKDGKLLNNFNRPLFFTGEEENVVFQNFICSVEADVILQKLTEIFLFLKKKKSKIIFSFYDCLCLFIYKDEINIIDEIKNKMENIDKFDIKFPISISTGNNWGNLENVA